MNTVERVCEGFKRHKRAILFGASERGRLAYDVLKDKIEIIAFSDNDPKKQGGEFCGTTIIPPSDIKKYTNCTVLITSTYESEISYQLSQMELENFYVFLFQYSSIENIDFFYTIREPLNVSYFENIEVSDERRRKNLKDYSNFLNPLAPMPNFSISTEEINYCDDKNKNILFIAPSFPPIGGSGVQRSSKFVKYLKRMGYNPIVVAWGNHSVQAGYRVKDESLLVDIHAGVSVIRIDYTIDWMDLPDRNETIEGCYVIDGIIDDTAIMNSFLEDMRRYNTANHRDGVIITPWTPSVLRVLERILDFKRIGVVYTTSPPPDNFFTGFYIKSKYGIPWVADYRDEWTNFPDLDKVGEVEIAIESGISRKADAIILLNNIMSDRYCNAFGISENFIFLIPNGYDEDDFLMDRTNIEDIKVNQKLTIRYGGNIYYEMDPIHEFIDVLSSVVDEGLIDGKKIQIEVTGNSNETTIGIIKECDKHQIFSMRPYVPHNEIIRNMMSADVLLLFGRVGKSTYTGKIFEYIRMGVPIFAVGDGGGAADELIVSTNTGVFFDRTDKIGMKKALTEMYNNFFTKGIPYNPNYDEIKKYSREYLTKKLINVFQSVIENPSR